MYAIRYASKGSVKTKDKWKKMLWKQIKDFMANLAPNFLSLSLSLPVLLFYHTCVCTVYIHSVENSAFFISNSHFHYDKINQWIWPKALKIYAYTMLLSNEKCMGAWVIWKFIEMEFGTTEKRHKNNINLGTPGERGWEEIVVGFDISIKRYCAF